MLYADYNGSSPLLPVVRDYLRKRLDSDLFGNPNAIHSLGQKLHRGLEKSRSVIAEVVGAHPDQVILNSGSSEGISTILHSLLTDTKKKTVITSPVEHVAVAKALEWYREHEGFQIEFCRIDRAGVVDLSHLRELVERHFKDLALVTIMASQNETGVIEPLEKITETCREFSVPCFSDTTQFIGKVDFHFEKSGLDFAVCSGHKVGALSGTGFIIAKDPTILKTLIFGSTQEKGIRGGTQHYLGFETLAVALAEFREHGSRLKDLEAGRKWFEAEMKRAFPAVVIIGEEAPRLPGTTLIGYPGLHGQAVQIELESQDVIVTTSAACSDNQPETSAVLRAMGVSEDLGRSVVRVSLSYSHGQKDYEHLARALSAAYEKLRKIRSF